MRIARLMGLEPDEQCEACHGSLDPGAPADYRELATLLVREWSKAVPRRVGLAGGQGAGKSTLARLIEAAGEHYGLAILCLSLDDFYRSKADRQDLAREVHPLFETRGPPGTHEIATCRRVMAAALSDRALSIPRFDKGRDDRAPSENRRGPFDIVVLEGWCVGARAVPESALLDPVNALEAEEDPDGVWRRAVNRVLAQDYEPLWDELDQLVFLAVPSLDSVRAWRARQEEERQAHERMSSAEVDRFVAHYERITRRMSRDLASRADWTIELDPSHAIAGCTRRR